MCERCGDCCKEIAIPLKIPPGFRGMAHEFYRARGYEIVNLGGWWGEAARKRERCPHLTDNNLCDIYERRPEICRRGKCPKKK